MTDDDNISIIAFALGSGLAPIRALLQHRVWAAKKAVSNSADDSSAIGKVTLFAGHKHEDTALVAEIIGEAITLRLFDILSITPSNPNKQRAQDKMFSHGVPQQLVQQIKSGAFVFACGNPAAVEEFRENLNGMMGCDVRKALAEKYIEEVY
jgi:sulfite reductase alpha subunit-like flavoprotein